MCDSKPPNWSCQVSTEALFERTIVARGYPGWPAVFVVQRTPTLGLNPMLRQHWKKRDEEKTAWAWELACALTPNERRWLRAPSEKKQRMTVWIRFFWQTRRLDPDNLTAAAKNIIDALKVSRFIHNDSARWINLTVEQFLMRQNRREGNRGPETHIWLEPLSLTPSSDRKIYTPADRRPPPASQRVGR